MGKCASLPLGQNIQFEGYKRYSGSFILNSCCSEGKMWSNLLSYVSGGLTHSVFLHPIHPSDVILALSYYYDIKAA